MTPISNIKEAEPNSKFVVVIVAENWDEKDLQIISNSIDLIFHFKLHPNEFEAFDED